MQKANYFTSLKCHALTSHLVSIVSFISTISQLLIKATSSSGQLTTLEKH